MAGTKSTRRPVVHSEYLFRSLARLFDVDLICDVGAFDGAHAKRFCRPGVRVVAFEANPMNFAALDADPEIGARGIDLRHRAMTNFDGETDFNLVKLAPEAGREWISMISAIRPRSAGVRFDSETIVVPAGRLDTFVVQELRPAPSRIALWIDVEGSSYEALEGMTGIEQSVCVVHAEVEMQSFWEGQHLWADVEALMRRRGFTALARGPGDLQFDVVFVRDVERERHPARVRGLLFVAWCRLRAGRLRARLRRMLGTVRRVIHEA
jgi:FkbM family methyltransferase